MPHPTLPQEPAAPFLDIRKRPRFPGAFLLSRRQATRRPKLGAETNRCLMMTDAFILGPGIESPLNKRWSPERSSPAKNSPTTGRNVALTSSEAGARAVSCTRPKWWHLQAGTPAYRQLANLNSAAIGETITCARTRWRPNPTLTDGPQFPRRDDAAAWPRPAQKRIQSLAHRGGGHPSQRRTGASRAQGR